MDTTHIKDKGSNELVTSKNVVDKCNEQENKGFDNSGSTVDAPKLLTELSHEEAYKIAWGIVRLFNNLSYRQYTRILDNVKLILEETPISLQTG